MTYWFSFNIETDRWAALIERHMEYCTSYHTSRLDTAGFHYNYIWFTEKRGRRQ